MFYLKPSNLNKNWKLSFRISKGKFFKFNCFKFEEKKILSDSHLKIIQLFRLWIGWLTDCIINEIIFNKTITIRTTAANHFQYKKNSITGFSNVIAWRLDKIDINASKFQLRLKVLHEHLKILSLKTLF